MLDGNLCKRPVKRAISAQPFIDDNAQSILIACWARMRLDLLGSHVGNGSCRILGMLGG